MFGNRKDGKKLKNLPPEFRLIPILMKERDDSQVFFKTDISITAIEEYIDKKKEEGINLGIMDVIFATVIRMISERPLLNRFCINGMTYAFQSKRARQMMVKRQQLKYIGMVMKIYLMFLRNYKNMLHTIKNQRMKIRQIKQQTS